MGVRAGRSRRLCLLLIELPVTRFLLLIIYTACGLALSLAVNVVSFTSIPLGENFPFPALLWGLSAFLSVILIGRSERNKVTTDERDVDYWGLLLAGCPAALKYAFWACFAYTWLLGMVFAVRHTHEIAGGMARRLGLLHDVLRHGPRCERWRLFPRPQLTAAAPLIYEQERWPRLRATPRRYRQLASGNEYLFVTRSQRVMQALLQTGPP